MIVLHVILQSLKTKAKNAFPNLYQMFIAKTTLNLMIILKQFRYVIYITNIYYETNLKYFKTSIRIYFFEII